MQPRDDSEAGRVPVRKIIGHCNVCGDLFEENRPCGHTALYFGSYIPEPPPPGRAHCETVEELFLRRPELRQPEVKRIPGPDSVAHTFGLYRDIYPAPGVYSRQQPIAPPGRSWAATEYEPPWVGRHRRRERDFWWWTELRWWMRDLWYLLTGRGR